MTAKEIIKELMKAKNMTNAQMASALNITQASLWARLNPTKTDNMTVKKLNSMLRILGYEVAIVPRARTSRIEGAYLVEDSDISSNDKKVKTPIEEVIKPNGRIKLTPTLDLDKLLEE